MKTVEEQLADLTTAVGKVTESVTAIAGQVAEIKAKGAGAGDGKVIVLETKLAGIEAAMQVQAKGAAQAKVAEAIKAGKIPAQNKDLIAQWENLLVIDAKNAALIDALPVNPALVSIVGAGAGSGSAQTTTEHAFVVKAKEHAKANNITDIVDAQSQFARTVEGAGLYADYIANLGK